MRLILVFLFSVVLATCISYILFKYFKINLPPSIVGLFLFMVWAFLPDRWTKKITGEDYEQ